MKVIVHRHVAGEASPEAMGRLAACTEIDVVDFRSVDELVALANHASTQGLAMPGWLPIDSSHLDELPALEIVALRSVGIDSVDLEALTDRDVILCNTPDVLNRAVAELTLMLMLALARNLPTAIEAAHGTWFNTGDKPPPGFDLTGKRLGLIGFGGIGRQVASIASKGFAMDVIYANARGAGVADDSKFGATYASLKTVLESADFVSLHAPLTASTRGLIAARELARMSDHAYLINVARGGLVDEAALVAALDDHRLAGAATDVMEIEPFQPEHPLLNHPRVIATPHIGSNTHETRQEMADLTLENLERHACGQPPSTPVTIS